MNMLNIFGENLECVINNNAVTSEKYFFIALVIVITVHFRSNIIAFIKNKIFNKSDIRFNNFIKIIIKTIALAVILNEIVYKKSNIVAILKYKTTPSWFSAIGTITAAFLALLPQIKKLRSSNLLFQAVLDYQSESGYIVKINIFNFIDRSEIIKADYIKSESVDFYYGVNDKKDKKFFSDKTLDNGKEVHHPMIRMLTMSDEKNDYYTDFKINPMIVRGKAQVSDVNRALPITYNKSQVHENLSDDFINGKNFKDSYLLTKANITVVRVHAETAKNKDDYWFYTIIISYLDKTRIYKSSTRKNIDESSFVDEIEKIVNEIKPELFEKLQLV